MPPLPLAPKKAIWVLLVASLFGFADAAYLAAKFFLGETPKCFLVSGCDVVTTSAYATIARVPIALLGAIFYLSIFILSVAYLDRRAHRVITILFIFSVPAFLFTLYLVYLQLFVLNAICIYCMFSALTTTTIFITSLYLLRASSRVSNTTL